MTTVYEAAGGEAGLLELARAWHKRVMADEVVSHAFSPGYRPDRLEADLRHRPIGVTQQRGGSFEPARHQVRLGRQGEATPSTSPKPAAVR